MNYVDNSSEKLNKKIEREQRVRLPQEVPNILVKRGIVQPEDWLNLDSKTKLYILEAHIGKDWAEQLGLKDKESGSDKSESSNEKTDIPHGVYEEKEKDSQKEIDVAEMQEDKKVNDEFEKIKREIASEESQSQESDQIVQDSQEEMTKEDKQRVETEQGGKQSKIKFFGYQPSSQLVQASNKVSEEGDVEDASTWIATIIKKLLVTTD